MKQITIIKPNQNTLDFSLIYCLRSDCVCKQDFGSIGLNPRVTVEIWSNIRNEHRSKLTKYKTHNNRNQSQPVMKNLQKHINIQHWFNSLALFYSPSNISLTFLQTCCTSSKICFYAYDSVQSCTFSRSMIPGGSFNTSSTIALFLCLLHSLHTNFSPTSNIYFFIAGCETGPAFLLPGIIRWQYHQTSQVTVSVFVCLSNGSCHWPSPRVRQSFIQIKFKPLRPNKVLNK